MNHFIGQVFESKNGGTCPYIAFLEPVTFMDSVLTGH